MTQDNSPKEVEFSFHFIAQVFTVLFATEIVFRLVAVGPKAFTRSRWNVFDTTVVSGSLLGYFYKSAEGLSIFRTLRLVGGHVNLIS